MIKIIIFTDIRIYCEGLSQILSKVDTLEVVGAESLLDDALVKIELARPDVILLDMTMRGSSAAVKEFSQRLPRTKIVALAVPETEQNVIECAEAGVSSYVAREASIDELIDTVISAREGEFCCPPRIAELLFNKFQTLARRATENCLLGARPPADAELAELTRREQQVLGLIADGMSNKQISSMLVIEVSTVKNHVHNILVKLGVHSRVQAVSLFRSRQELQGSRSLGIGNRQEIYT